MMGKRQEWSCEAVTHGGVSRGMEMSHGQTRTLGNCDNSQDSGSEPTDLRVVRYLNGSSRR